MTGSGALLDGHETMKLRGDRVDGVHAHGSTQDVGHGDLANGISLGRLVKGLGDQNGTGSGEIGLASSSWATYFNCW